MKPFALVVIVGALVAAALLLPQESRAGVSVGVSLGVPAPVVAYPAPAYYPPAYYAPAPVYGPGVVVAPGMAGTGTATTALGATIVIRTAIAGSKGRTRPLKGLAVRGYTVARDNVCLLRERRL